MTKVINKNHNAAYYISPSGITINGRTRTYATYKDMIQEINPPSFAWVEDASGDSTVNSGSAFYRYKDGKYIKLYETECMDSSTNPENIPSDYSQLMITVGEIQSTLVDHYTNSSIHVTNADKQNWNNKVDKVAGKGLSSHDFTTEEKQKLNSLKNYDDDINRLEENKADNDTCLSLQRRIGICESDISTLQDELNSITIVANEINRIVG